MGLMEVQLGRTLVPLGSKSISGCPLMLPEMLLQRVTEKIGRQAVFRAWQVLLEGEQRRRSKNAATASAESKQ